MKNRDGFVSNSSTSSFIVATKEGKAKGKISIEVDLEDYARETLRTLADVETYFLTERYYEKDELENSEEFQEVKKAIENGKIVLVGSFSSEGDPMEAFLCENGIAELGNEDVQIILGEGGY